jgi:hypothetical protein
MFVKYTSHGKAENFPSSAIVVVEKSAKPLKFSVRISKGFLLVVVVVVAAV